MLRRRIAILFVLFALANANVAVAAAKKAILTTVVLGSLSRSSEEPFTFEPILHYALGENDRKLASCGYRIQPLSLYYQRAEKLGPRELAESLERDGAWIIWGPGNSRDFLLATKGILETPLITPTANARAVTALPPPFFTMYPPIDELAEVARKGVQKFKLGQRYGVFVDAGCPSCKDFAAEFERMGANELSRHFWIDTAGEAPDLLPLRAAIAENRIDFLLLPNHETLSGYVMQELGGRVPKLKYVGFDFWGDESLSALEPFLLPETNRGIAVGGGRSGIEMQNFYEVHSLFRQWQGKAVLPSYSHFQLIDFVRSLTQLLCEIKPRDRADFRMQMKSMPRPFFRSKLGVSLYELRGKRLNFVEHFGARRK